MSTHECIDKKELIELRRRAALYDEQKPEKWEPPEGNWRLHGDGRIWNSTDEDYRKFGTVFTSIEQAEEAKPLIRSHNRLIRYVQEHGGVKEFLKGEVNWTVDCDMNNAIIWRSSCSIGVIYMTKECAESLAAGLKDGAVVL